MTADTWLRYGELDEDHDGFPQQYANLSRDRDVPALSGGVIWPDESNKILYSYGGEFNGEAVAPFDDVWFYDIVYNTWNVSNATTKNFERAAWGMSVESEGNACH